MTPCIESLRTPSQIQPQIWDGQQVIPESKFVWTKCNGPIPDGLLVHRRCGNPRCIRLDHLFLGTLKDNTKRVWERLMAKSVWNGACLVFTGTPSSKYGRTSIGGTHLNLYVHRVVYELIHGEIPPGYDICHRCDVPKCIYPPHLFLGTRSDNMQDCIQKGRWNDGSRRSSGEKNGRAVLTDNQVKDLRVLRSGGWTYQSLSEKFNISITQVARLARLEQRA